MGLGWQSFERLAIRERRSTWLYEHSYEEWCRVVDMVEMDECLSMEIG